MNDKMTFCEECRKDVAYSVETMSMKGTLKGEDYNYTGKKSVCSECGNEVYVAEIEDENLKALYDVYLRINDTTRKLSHDEVTQLEYEKKTSITHNIFYTLY